MQAGENRDDENDTSQTTGDDRSVRGILDRVGQVGDGDAVTVRQIVEGLGGQSFGPLLLVPALIVVTPVSGVPGLSSIGGIIIATIALQMAIGRRHIWLPGWILRKSIRRGQIKKALSFLQKPAGFVDRITRQRLSFLVRPPLLLVCCLICVVCGMAMPFLELVPMTASILATAVSLFAVAIVTDDGLLALFGLGVIGAAITLLTGIF